MQVLLRAASASSVQYIRGPVCNVLQSTVGFAPEANRHSAVFVVPCWVTYGRGEWQVPSQCFVNGSPSWVPVVLQAQELVQCHSENKHDSLSCLRNVIGSVSAADHGDYCSSPPEDPEVLRASEVRLSVHEQLRAREDRCCAGKRRARKNRCRASHEAEHPVDSQVWTNSLTEPAVQLAAQPTATSQRVSMPTFSEGEKVANNLEHRPQEVQMTLDRSNEAMVSTGPSTAVPETFVCSNDGGSGSCDREHGGSATVESLAVSQHSVSEELHVVTNMEDIVGSVWAYSLSSSGCRTVQNVLEEASGVEKLRLAEELRGHVLEAIKSPCANFVLQKCIEVLPVVAVQFVVDELRGHAAPVCRHRFGCRILQRLIEHCPFEQIAEVMEEVLAEADVLVRHRFGSFVLQHIIEHGTSNQRHLIVDVLVRDAVRLCKHRLASHVVQRALTHCDLDDKQRLVGAIGNNTRKLRALAHTQYGSFVAREMHSRCKAQDRIQVLDVLGS
mmetsp:Transcript_29579/g.78267  ORF Transcript_29579/g.78267 Transcript_29579/m.78267 type:complete len:500 (-) Transcript_29579:327-1826(-)